MIRTGAAIFFENARDFGFQCTTGSFTKDPYERRYEYKRIPIQYPSRFPAAFKYWPEDMFDPLGGGSYVETDFEMAYFAAVKGLKSEIAMVESQLHDLDVLARERHVISEKE